MFKEDKENANLVRKFMGNERSGKRLSFDGCVGIGLVL
jgi:hypothetical protein